MNLVHPPWSDGAAHVRRRDSSGGKSADPGRLVIRSIQSMASSAIAVTRFQELLSGDRRIFAFGSDRSIFMVPSLEIPEG